MDTNIIREIVETYAAFNWSGFSLTKEETANILDKAKSPKMAVRMVTKIATKRLKDVI